MAEVLQEELNDMTRDEQWSAKEVWHLGTQLANVLRLEARVTPPASVGLQDEGRKYTDSPDCSGTNWTQLKCWIA